MNSSINLKNFAFLKDNPTVDTLHAVITANAPYDKGVSYVQYYNAHLSSLVDAFEMGVEGPYVLFINDHFLPKSLLRDIVHAQRHSWLELAQGDIKDILLETYVNFTLHVQSMGSITPEERGALWTGLPLNEFTSEHKRSLHISMLSMKIQKTMAEQLMPLDDMFDLYKVDSFNFNSPESSLLF